MQRVVTLAVEVLDAAAYGSNTHKVNTTEVRLALAVLWCILREKRWLHEYWHKANNVSGHPWESCRKAHYGIKRSLRDEGWHAPVGDETMVVE